MNTQTLSKRDFLKLAAAGALGARVTTEPASLLAAESAAVKRKIPFALQLYSVRNECAKDLPGTVAAVAKMGFKAGELDGFVAHLCHGGDRAGEILRALIAHGVKLEGERDFAFHGGRLRREQRSGLRGDPSAQRASRGKFEEIPLGQSLRVHRQFLSEGRVYGAAPLSADGAYGLGCAFSHSWRETVFFSWSRRNVPFLFPTTMSGSPSPLRSPATTCVPTPESLSMRYGMNSTLLSG